MKLYPLHNALVLQYHIKPVLKEIIKLSDGTLLDIGCGEKPFLKYVQDKVDKYIGLDHPDTPHSKNNIDIFSTAYQIPFENNNFDIALLTQVLEHLESPELALKEINRILKPGGKLIIAWPFLFPLHEAPRDFYRYTKFGMSHLAKETNYTVEKIVPVSGFWITLFGFISIYFFGKSKFIYFILSPLLIIILFLCLIGNLTDQNKNSKDKWTWNYYAILKKNMTNA